ncbi:MAG: hypothetical protein JWP25_6029 [Bradyrhizobium sp.]|jgi:hypothetical protein|nr:hypothetical protein [Bradyrhizobium sp.]
MRKLLVILTLTSALVSTNALAQDAGIIPSTVPPAPVGHVQPTKRNFAPESTANAIEQQRLSTFDTKQQRLDEMLDKKLSICRC